MIDSASLTQEQWAGVAKELFEALDNIDTASDMAKGNDNLYRNLIELEHEKRFRWQHLFDTDSDVSKYNQPPKR